MNQEIKEHVKNALKQGYRIDGRKPDEVRKIELEKGIISTAEGSARLKYGDGELIAGVKISVGHPFPDSPEDGVIMVNSEMLPLSNEDFETGPPGIDAIETSRVIDRGIRESGSIDTKKLCIKKGEDVWMINVDITPINYDGNLIDMGGLAAVAALEDAKFPSLTDGKVDYKNITDKGLELKKQPIPVTVCKVGDVFMVDLTDEEEKTIDARLTVTVLEDDNICSMQKGGDVPLKIDDIDKMISLAIKTSKELRKSL